MLLFGYEECRYCPCMNGVMNERESRKNEKCIEPNINLEFVNYYVNK